MVEIPALIIGTVATFLIALTVFSKNNRSLTNILFVSMAAALIGWSYTTYFSLHTSSDIQTLSWMRPIMFFVVLQNTFFFLLVHTFPAHGYDIFKKKRYILAVVFSAITAIVALSPLLFIDFKDGAPVPGPGMALFLPHALIFAVGGIISLIVRFVKSKGVEKAQLQYFLAGTVLLYTLLPIGNFIVPLVFKSKLFVTLSPLYAIIFSGLFAYGIVAKRLFDIRAVVARSVAYVLSLGFIGLIYGAIIYIISSVFSFNHQSVGVERAIYVVLALVTAVLYPPVKWFFAKVTTRIFYQDAYDPQIFLDSLNKILVSRVDLVPLLSDVADLIEANIKVDYCVFTIRKSAYYTSRTIGTKSKQFSTEDAVLLHKLTPKIHQRVLITDELNEDQADLKAVLSKYDVGVLVRLVSTVKLDVEGIGYLVLGPKKSGNIYTKQDEDIIRIIANELVIAIENALKFEEIQKFNETLQEKIDRATKSMRHANLQLKELDEAKDEFISMASHQLRTPLTTVKGYVSMLDEGDFGKLTKEQQQTIVLVLDGSNRMARLIDDLLNISRMEAGKFYIDAQKLDLYKIVREELESLKNFAVTKKVHIALVKPKSAIPIMLLDENKTRQVVMNLIDNAINYSQPPSGGGKVEITLGQVGKQIVFKVIDNGIGVPADQQAKLFTKMFRARNAKDVRPDGTGLGLYLVKRVIEDQGGKIIFQSKTGKGSEFGFSIPIHNSIKHNKSAEAKLKAQSNSAPE